MPNLLINPFFFLFVTLALPLLLPIAQSVTIPIPPLIPHPRIVLTNTALTSLLNTIHTNAEASAYFQGLQIYGDGILPLPPIAQPPSGPTGMLIQVREVLDRVQTLVVLYRVTSNTTYADRAIKELLNFTSWNSWNALNHTLDTAEACNAAGFGFDQLNTYMNATTREAIRQGIITLGLEPLYQGYALPDKTWNWWVNTTSNWNAVVGGGAIVGALSVLGPDDVTPPPFVSTLLSLAISSMQGGSLTAFAPDGSWHEGIGYSGYCTQYVVAGASALLTATSSSSSSSSSSPFDAGILESPFVNVAGQFFLYGTSFATQRHFDWSDDGTGAASAINHLGFLGNYFQDPAVSFVFRLLNARTYKAPKPAPFAMPLVWFAEAGTASDVEALDLDKFFPGRHMVVSRSSWLDWDSSYMGWKGGNNTYTHGHLDIGSFVYENGGVRFAEDLSADSYALPEYFGPLRWSYYRLNTWGHNTLMFNGHNQDPNGICPFISYNDTSSSSSSQSREMTVNTWAVTDITDAYKAVVPGIVSTVRGFVSLQGRQDMLIVDELVFDSKTSGNVFTNFTWAMHTTASVLTSSSSPTSLTLSGYPAYGNNTQELVTVILMIVQSDSSCPGASFVTTPVSLLPPQEPTPNLTRIDIVLVGDDAVRNCTRLSVYIGNSGDALPSANFHTRPLNQWESVGPIVSS